MRDPSRRQGSHRGRAFWKRFATLLQVLCAVLGVQLSGAAHFAADALSVATTGAAEHDDECPLDGPCDECPAGCPSCHCSNVLRTLAPGMPLAWGFDAPETRAGVSLPEGRVPPRPDLPSLYRPPRVTPRTG